MVLLLLILWPVAEIFVAVEIANAIGFLPMLLLLIAGWPVGLWALHSQGRAAWRRLSDAVAAKQNPGREVLNGALVVLGGLLMLIPGFITDAFGLFLLLPPTRALARGLLVRNLQSRVVVSATRVGGRHSYDVDSTATDIDQPQLHS
jgi:UPF0716 protein FxsA